MLKTNYQFLINNGKIVAKVDGAIDFKEVQASFQCGEDALNAEYPAILINAKTYKVSSAQKYQAQYAKMPADKVVYAAALEGGRPGQFLLDDSF